MLGSFHINRTILELMRPLQVNSRKCLGSLQHHVVPMSMKARDRMTLVKLLREQKIIANSLTFVDNICTGTVLARGKSGRNDIDHP